MGYWLKSYTDILEDKKYHKMPERAQLAMHEIFLVCKMVEQDKLTGLVPCIEDIAWLSRKPEEYWKEVIPELIKYAIIREEGNGYLIINYVKRQQPIPDDERMRQYRDRKNKKVMEGNDCETEESHERYEDETNRNGERERRVLRESTDREEAPPPNFYSQFQAVIGLLLAGDKDFQYLKTLVQDYGEEKILKIAAWLRKKDPDLKSMRNALRSIDTAASNWGETQKQMGEVGKEFTADQILGVQQ